MAHVQGWAALVNIQSLMVENIPWEELIDYHVLLGEGTRISSDQKERRLFLKTMFLSSSGILSGKNVLDVLHNGNPDRFFVAIAESIHCLPLHVLACSQGRNRPMQVILFRADPGISPFPSFLDLVNMIVPQHKQRKKRGGRPTVLISELVEATYSIIEKTGIVSEYRRRPTQPQTTLLPFQKLYHILRKQGFPMSESSIRRLFVPPHLFSLSARYYSCLLQYRICSPQSIVLKEHMDSHTCTAQLKYAKEIVYHSTYSKDCLVMSWDNKAIIHPGNCLMQKTTIVKGLGSTKLRASAFLNAKERIPPFIQHIPIHPETIMILEKTEDGRSIGDTFVHLRCDERKQTASCHFSTLMRWIQEGKIQSKPILFILSDGGADVNPSNYPTLIMAGFLFQLLQLESIVLIACAPGNSPLNPVERAMAIFTRIIMEKCPGPLPPSTDATAVLVRDALNNKSFGNRMISCEIAPLGYVGDKWTIEMDSRIELHKKGIKIDPEIETIENLWLSHGLITYKYCCLTRCKGCNSCGKHAHSSFLIEELLDRGIKVLIYSFLFYYYYS
jgi:hypothetical protein